MCSVDELYSHKNTHLNDSNNFIIGNQFLINMIHRLILNISITLNVFIFKNLKCETNFKKL